MSEPVGGGGLVPPVATTVRHESTVHGDVRVDEYAWLRDRSDPEVMGHLRAEDAWATAWMEPTRPLQERLYREMLARIKETDVSVPYRKRGFWYYVRTEEGKQYAFLCRKAGSLDAEEQVTIDMNAMAEGHGYFALGEYEVSDDGNLLLFSTDTTGYREYTLRAKDLRTGEILPLAIERVSSAAFAADGRTIFYVVDDPVSKRPCRFCRRRLDDPASEDLIHEETDERFSLVVGRTRSDRFVLLTIGSHTASEVRFLSASDPGGTFATIEPRRPEIEYDVSHGDGLFYIRVNDTGRNFRLVTAPIESPGREHWREVVAHRPEVMLEAVDVFRSHFVLYERRDGLGRLRIVDLGSGDAHEIVFPEPAYALGSDVNAEFDATTYRYRYQSPITPLSVFEHDIATRKETLLKETPVLGGYDRTLYAVERIHAAAADGTRVPITLAYRKDRTSQDRPSAMHLLGYGAYGIPYPAGFSSSRVSLLDRGVAFAIAHVRGGGEMGKPWHDQGRMAAKANSFSDFVACAEHLVREGRTGPDRLVIEGGSAGGLLVGAAVNLRPDLFRAVVTKVPFVDVVNTMLDPSLPLTVGEFEEWGDPRNPEDYARMKGYCPYTNLERKAYPAMLVKTSTEDSQVMFWEPAKYVARLRALKTDANPVLFKVNFSAGHGGASGRYDALRETAFDFAFILAILGIEEIEDRVPPAAPAARS